VPARRVILVMLDFEERRRHLHVVGQTGTGKSTLLLVVLASILFPQGAPGLHGVLVIDCALMT
jgi:ABC-type molybdenum transport system ATPase subunit/photorepair protein PhrA